MITKRELKQFQKQKETSLPIVVQTYGGFVKAVCHSIIAPIAGSVAVDECVNDSFLKAWNKAHTYKGEVEQFKYWLGTIARRVAIDHYRQYKRRLEEEIPLAYLPERAIAEEDNGIFRYLNVLDELDRQIFYLKYYELYSQRELAEHFNLSVSSIDNRLYRGRKTIERAIQKGEIEDD